MFRWMGSYFEAAFHQVKARYKVIKKQKETILDRLVDDSIDTGEDLLLTTRKLGDKFKANFLQIAFFQEVCSLEGFDIIHIFNVNSSGKNGWHPWIKTKLEWSTTIASTNMGWMSQISSYLQKGIQSLDDEQRTIATFSKCDATRIVVDWSVENLLSHW